MPRTARIVRFAVCGSSRAVRGSAVRGSILGFFSGPPAVRCGLVAVRLRFGVDAWQEPGRMPQTMRCPGRILDCGLRFEPRSSRFGCGLATVSQKAVRIEGCGSVCGSNLAVLRLRFGATKVGHPEHREQWLSATHSARALPHHHAWPAHIFAAPLPRACLSRAPRILEFGDWPRSCDTVTRHRSITYSK